MQIKRRFIDYAITQGYFREEILDQEDWDSELRTLYRTFLAGYVAAKLDKHE